MKDKIIFIATAWGTKHGGINSFNYDLCIALAKMASTYEIICVVDETSNSNISDEEKKIIRLIYINNEIELPSQIDFIISESLQNSNGDNSKIIWFVGHDSKTGMIAIECKLKYEMGSKCAIIHHMDYQAYESIKPDTDYSNLNDKLKTQKKILKGGDVVFAVGPKLRDSANDKLRGQTNKAIELFPGLADIDGYEKSNKFDAIIFGRFDNRIDQVKQYKLAIAGCAKAIGNNKMLFGPDPGITFVGIDKLTLEDEKQIRVIIETHAGQLVRFNPLPFEENRISLFDELKSHSVCLMLSLHEGFGLVGWESIAAEVPLILSQNTGVFQLIEERLGGIGIGNLLSINLKGSNNREFTEEDTDKVVEALVRFKHKEDIYKENAVVLKGLLKNFFTWENTAYQFAQGINLDNIQYFDLQIDVKNYLKQILSLINSPDSSKFRGINKRKAQFEIIWDRLRTQAVYKKRLIFFGGVASSLCDEDAFGKFYQWLSDNNEAQLFFCYETGRSATERAKKLNEQKLVDGYLSAVPDVRMTQKEKIVINLCNKLDSSFENPKRHFFIPINEPLNSYIIIADNNIFLTPLFEKRSSETITFALENDTEFNLDILNYLNHHLNEVEKIEKLDKNLVQINKEIETLINTFNYRNANQ